MTTDPQVDFNEPDQNQLAVIVQESGLEQSKAKYILEKFQDYFKLADEWTQATKTIKVTDASQTHLMDMARVARLAMRDKRLEIEKSRKELKEQSLREGKAIDGIANVLKALIVPLEEYYADQECWIERRAAEKAKLIEQEVQARLDREFEEEQARKKEEDARIRAENEHLKEEAYRKEQELAAERRANEEKLAEERRRVAYEQEKIKKENEAKIAEENRKRQAELELVRKQEAEKLAKERAEREKVEAELRAKKDAEAKEERERIAKEEALKKAGDSEKLKILMDNIIQLNIPGDIKSKESKIALSSVMRLLADAVNILKLVVKEEEVDF